MALFNILISDTQARDFFLFTYFCSLYQNKQGEASIAIKHESNTIEKWYKRLLDTQSQSRESNAIFQLLSLYIDKISTLDSVYFSEDLSELANNFKNIGSITRCIIIICTK